MIHNNNTIYMATPTHVAICHQEHQYQQNISRQTPIEILLIIIILTQPFMQRQKNIESTNKT